MTDEQKVAYVFSQSVAAMSVIEGMKATNRERVSKGFTEPYDENAFNKVIDSHCIGHNDVIALFQNL
ncbi:hypothetical protein KAR91_01135 [Candidatus Pacearchaeota archaeon]|nr:hypothetical protein [Candidatus Pacearchaeota archaeon]